MGVSNSDDYIRIRKYIRRPIDGKILNFDLTIIDPTSVPLFNEDITKTDKCDIKIKFSYTFRRDDLGRFLNRFNKLVSKACKNQLSYNHVFMLRN